MVPEICVILGLCKLKAQGVNTQGKAEERRGSTLFSSTEHCLLTLGPGVIFQFQKKVSIQSKSSQLFFF